VALINTSILTQAKEIWLSTNRIEGNKSRFRIYPDKIKIL
jgi:hypothetical protein